MLVGISVVSLSLNSDRRNDGWKYTTRKSGWTSSSLEYKKWQSTKGFPSLSEFGSINPGIFPGGKEHKA